MQLWLRYKTATNLHWDQQVQVTTEKQWHMLVADLKIISSVLWPTDPLFTLHYAHKRRHHRHEMNYQHDTVRNADFINACQQLAIRIYAALRGRRALVYAPLRGALPIWRGITQFLPNDTKCDVYYPVTSSFVSYPVNSPIRKSNRKPAFGTYTHMLELQRIRPFLADYEVLLYVDEIISGSMMRKYINDMCRLRIHNTIPIIAAGIADAYGTRSEEKRAVLEAKVCNGSLEAFIWEGCKELITEDQKFLLGVHYVNYNSGLNAVPLLNDNLEFYPEKIMFDKQIFT